MNFLPYPKKPHLIWSLLTSVTSSITTIPLTHFPRETPVFMLLWIGQRQPQGLCVCCIIGQCCSASDLQLFATSSRNQSVPFSLWTSISPSLRWSQRKCALVLLYKGSIAWTRVKRARICRLQSVRTWNIWSHRIELINIIGNQVKRKDTLPIQHCNSP